MKAYIIDRERVFETLAQLENYNDKNKAVTKGLRKASRILSVAGRRALLVSNKKKTGNLYRSISYIIKRKSSGSIAGFKRASEKNQNAKGNHAHLIDKGTRQRFTKDGQNRGKVTGSGFWTRTVGANEQKVYTTLYEAIEESVLRLIKRK